MGEMTNENAIRWLKDLLKSDLPMEQYQTALEKGIEALDQEPCDDAISRQAVQDYIAKYLSQYLYNDVREAVEVIDEYIGELPSVNPQPKTGHWIPIQESVGIFRYKCDKCGRYNRAISDYCPNCGAKMESEE